MHLLLLQAKGSHYCTRHAEYYIWSNVFPHSKALQKNQTLVALGGVFDGLLMAAIFFG